jgi:putative endonuclease
VYYVYILKSLKDGQIYTGYTSNLKLRLKEHEDGLVISTSFRKPLKLIYYEAYLDQKDAQARERYLKGGGKAKVTLKEQINNSLK